MSLELKQSLTIGVEQVEKVGAFSDITVYRSTTYDSTGLRLFFVKDGVAVQCLDVDADMGQGTGFVSSFEFITPKE